MDKEQQDKIKYDLAISDFFNENYGILLASFLQDNHDKFMVHVADVFEDCKGEKIQWQW